MGSVVFYIISFLICIIIIYMAEKNDKKISEKLKILLFVLALLIPIVISGIRYNVGTDFLTYYYSIDNINSMSINQLLQSDYEIGFGIIAKIAMCFNEEQVVFVIFAILTVIFAFLGILNKKEKISISLGMLVYLFMFFTSSFNGMRQCLAVVIMFFALKYIINKRFVKFLLFTLFAMCFHKTAIVLLPFYFILNIKNDNSLIKLVSLVAVTVLALNIDAFLNIMSNIELFEKYTVYTTGSIGGIGHIVLNILILFVLSIYIKRLIHYDKDNEKFFFLYLIGVILSMLSLKVVALARISSYFTIVLIYLLPAIPKVIKEKKEKECITILMFMFIILLFILEVYVFGMSDVIPYQTFIERS